MASTRYAPFVRGRQLATSSFHRQRTPAIASGVLALSFFAFGVGSAQADGGALDPAFAGTGMVSTPMPTALGDGTAVTLQGDGKIVIGGYLGSADRRYGQLALERYMPDGSRDASFGASGLVTTDIGGSDLDVINALAVQRDGKIVAAGDAGGLLALVRYDPNGALDSTFGEMGIASPSGSSAWTTGATAVALQPDGKIVVAGGSLARYNPDGSLDSSFGTNGVVTTGASGLALALQPDGKIVVGGFRRVGTGASSYAQFVVERYDSTGTRDLGFGFNGMVTTAIGDGDAYGRALALQPDGKILLAGGAVVHWQGVSALVRYTAGGALDSSFGDKGIVITAGDNLGYVSGANAVLLQKDGRIVTVGDGLEWSWGFGLARYLPDGMVDPTFGLGGIVTTTFGASTTASARAAALQPDGKIIAFGATWPSSPGPGPLTFALARYLTEQTHPLRLEKADGTGSGTVTSKPGGISCDSGCLEDAAQFADQSLVTLTARPVAGSAVSWKGACSGSGPVCTVTMSQAKRSVSVIFSRCVAPHVIGKRLAAAKRAIRRSHCALGRTRLQSSRAIPRGRVISQNPRRGTKLPAYTKINLVVSKGRT
jgi:uncharacterized delta-60 repeat protein